MVFFAFKGDRLLARGELVDVVAAMHAAAHGRTDGRLALYRESTGGVLDVDLRGDLEEVIARLAPLQSELGPDRRSGGRGRPKLGVVSREISLLPRHWEWLASTERSASATIRRLIDQAREADGGAKPAAQVVESLHRFIWDFAGDRPGFEEATRALFAHEFSKFRELIEPWPDDVRSQVERYLGALPE